MRKNIGFSIIIHLLTITLIFGTLFTGSAEEVHWAQETIEQLVGQGIIAGDENGIRPDDSITRAEVCALLNKNFSFTEMAEETFHDVPQTMWYFSEMGKAKQAGYLKGDERGNGNPEAFLTRAEACVIFANILGGESESSLSFRDNYDIPLWAEKSVSIMASKELIKGYENGMFLPMKRITRAEVFTILLNVNQYIYNTARFEPVQNNGQDVFNPVNSGSLSAVVSGSSGGGSGSGAGSGTATLQTPVITFVDTKNLTVSWGKVAKASGYTVILTAENGKGDKIENIKDYRVSIKEIINKIMKEEKDANQIVFSVKVMAVSSSGRQNSEYSEEVAFTVLTNAVEAPENVSVLQNMKNGEERITLTWDAVQDASGYEVFLVDGDTETQLSVEGTEAIFPDDYTYPETQTVKIRTLSSSSEKADSPFKTHDIAFPLYWGGSGTEQDPYLIANERHFYNIAKNASAVFLVNQDITLTNFLQIASFTGKLKGLKQGTEADAPIITYHCDSGLEKMGLFQKLDKAEVSNIGLAGTLKAGATSGSFAAEASAATLNGCFSNMEIAAGAGKNYGGLIGDAYDRTALNQCYFAGTITGTGSQQLGGLVGYLRAGATIKNCYNLGNIDIAKGVSVGGIVGALYGTLEGVYNAGDITGTDKVGGIGGFFKAAIVKAAFNTGSIHGSTNAGGIAAVLDYRATTNGMDEVYNVGDVSTVKGTDAGYIFASLNASGINPLQNAQCYFLEGIEGSWEQGQTEATSVCSSLSADALKAVQFTSGLWEVRTGYPYPQLKENPYCGNAEEEPPLPPTDPTVLSAPAVTLKQAMENDKEVFSFEWSAVDNAANYEISLIDNGEPILLTVTGTSAALPDDYEIADSVTVKIKALSANSDFTDSAYSEQSLPVPLYFGGKGTDASPYLISCERHLENISKNTDAVFRIDRDITLTRFTQLPEFTGKLFGAKNNESGVPVTVTYTYEEKGDNMGLFLKLTRAEIGWLIIEGNLSAGSCSGALAAEGNAASIHHCVSRMQMTFKDGSKNCGGLIGNTGGNTAVRDCGFEGTITGDGSYLGGIAGIIENRANVSNCYNLGNMTTRRANVGGIAGLSKGSVSSVYNTGNIKGGKNVGGIIGCTNNGVLLGAFNTGAVTSTTTFAGGIIGFLDPKTDNDNRMDELYNIGDVAASNSLNAGYIFSKIQTPSRMTIGKQIYFLEGITGSYEMDENNSYSTPKTEATSVCSSLSADALKAVQFTSGLWEVKEDYPYPQLKENPLK